MFILPRYIIREHIAPFIFSISIITFFFLLNFIVQSINRIIGKGLPLSVIFEFIFLNLAWIVALSVPMAVLIATLMAFGRLSSNNEIVAIKASGISLLRLILPILICAGSVALLLIQFNNHILPDFNHRARQLRSDILRKKPTFNLVEGIFNDDLSNFSILVEKIEYSSSETYYSDKSDSPKKAKNQPGDLLKKITIYDQSQQPIQRTIIAREGVLGFTNRKKQLKLTLFDGEIHEIDLNNPNAYRRLMFKTHTLYLPLGDNDFRRTESSFRGDREMSAEMMRAKIRGLKKLVVKEKEEMNKRIGMQFQFIHKLFIQDSSDSVIHMLDSSSKNELKNEYFKRGGSTSGQTKKNTKTQKKILSKARQLENMLQKQRRISDQLQTHQRSLSVYQKDIDRYQVEIYKKYSIPVACIVFVLIGAPLGIIARRGNFAVSGGISLGFFLLYWAFLIGGEELADRQFISPMVAMWAANILVGAIGFVLIIKTVLETSISVSVNSILGKISPDNKDKENRK